MHKTCFNCKYFHASLSDVGDLPYHIHNYCEKFGQVLDKCLESEVNSFLNTYWKTMCIATAGCDYGVSDDFETGEAVCWMYDQTENAFWPDEKFEANKNGNVELAVKTLEYMFANDEVWSEFEDGVKCRLADYMSEQELERAKNLLKKLRGEMENGD